MLFVGADLAESDRRHQPAAGRVLDEDAGQQFPETGAAGFGDQGIHRHAAGAPSAVGARDIDRELGDSVVALARTVG